MPLSPPPNQPFQRTQIRDGLLINASVWQDSHRYHRQRHSFQHQALFEPGIITGLGVAPVPAPAEMSSDYRDGRWLQIKPGIAIDAQGNPIIIPEAQVFHIQSAPTPAQGQQVVYLVANYVDPDDLETNPAHLYATETFRLVEKTTLAAHDVELCRINLSIGSSPLSCPTNVYAPEINQLDLRHRPIAHPKAQGEVQLTQVVANNIHQANAVKEGLTQLMRALTLLSPSLQGSPTVQQVPLTHLREIPTDPSKGSENYPAPDLIYLHRPTLSQLDSLGIQRLRSHLSQGGLLVIAVDFTEEPQLINLCNIRQELQLAVTNTMGSRAGSGDRSETQQKLTEELQAIDLKIDEQFEAIASALRPLATQLNNPLQGGGQLDPHHPLKQHPFLFGQLPSVQGQPIQVRQWDGIILLLGDLAAHCGLGSGELTPSHSIPRDQLRNNHEFGVNLLHFAWERRQMLQQLIPLNPSPSKSPPAALQPSLTEQLLLEESFHG